MIIDVGALREREVAMLRCYDAGDAGDDGIDGIIKEDRLGLDAIYLQAKRWQGTVGRSEIQNSSMLFRANV
jgi:restriction endonuclease Mrr